MSETVVNLVIQQLIRPFLKNADARTAEEELQANSNESVQIWVEEVREEAYRLEDVIDEFTFTMATLHRGGVLQQIYRSIKKLKLHHQIVTDIQDIKSSLVEIDERRKRHGLMMISIEQGSSLFKQYSREKCDSTCTGGLGKTTHAANVYKNKDMRSHFNCHAWIHVGKTPYTEKNNTKGLQFNAGEDEFCEDVDHGIPDNPKGRRIIITTRKRGVADFIPASIVHISVLKPLPSKEASQLFSVVS
ncbi:hypothetical protein ACOSQ3_013578 [Xanthoceras sorbifolium]